MFFRVRILAGLRDHISATWDLFWGFLGSLLETILGTFGVPFLHRFLEGFQDPPKVKAPRKVVLIWWVSGVQ